MMIETTLVTRNKKRKTRTSMEKKKTLNWHLIGIGNHPSCDSRLAKELIQCRDGVCCLLKYSVAHRGVKRYCNQNETCKNKTPL